MSTVKEPSPWVVKFDKHNPRLSTVSYKGDEVESITSINIALDAKGSMKVTLEIHGGSVRIVGHDGEE